MGIAEMAGGDPVLAIRGLDVRFSTPDGEVRAVKGVDIGVARGETVAIVGESGSGKSQTMMAVMGLLAGNGRAAGSARYAGRELIGLPAAELNRVRGVKISMIFQEPMTSLDPLYAIGRQVAEPIVHHQGIGHRQARGRAIELLKLVGIPHPERRVDAYPHELSGGQRQRVMIAMALANQPDVLIADEPTTALDVTIQAQILELIVELQREFGAAVILITHDLGVVAETARRVIVMYAGRKVEEAAVGELFADPMHPYTRGLLNSIPRLDLLRGEEAADNGRLAEIPGIVPPLFALPEGCAFAPRCPRADDKCRSERPTYDQKKPGHWAACWHPHG